MSTAVALQDMSRGTHDGNLVRHRSNLHKDTSPHKSSPGDDDDWVAQPQDTATANLPLDSRTFVPTNVYWITPHRLLTKEIKILDLTKDMSTPYTGFSNAYKDEVKKTLKDHSFTPIYTAHRNHWLGLSYDVLDDQGNKLADWSHPWTSVREATLKFPEDSTHASHTISLNNKTWGLRTESFTINSVPFIWQMDRLWNSNNMTLYRVFGSGDNQRKVEVGKYAQKWWGSFVTGGTFVVNEEEIDGFVAFNRDVRRHGRLVHSRQMTDHVVEQIDLLYWEAGAPSLESQPDGTEENMGERSVLYQTDNLTLDKHIAKLPVTWDTSTEPPSPSLNTDDEVSQDDYITSVVRLQDLSAKRLLLQQKLATYKTLLSLLEPYRRPQENIQPNLVSRDAPIATELTKARTLAIRVAGRVSEKYGDIQVPASADHGVDDEMHEQNSQVKLNKILEGW
ncbi:hypothetical protein BU24DRAFT_371747 [Aaosphaeria arxii CBS 175.79]|uniref:Uncharacterized protein n=1 Tax=Aaosphaeria arxii CBS 175.79 TaxID=1450172 RepID=A0A6A5XNT9_9PLEO|nr:uncharacterized protein BU24DRAFT_371747 [Aaosphaeria arxii CBS 175.79]KAF2014908.1 hypothetical protein BU24DRAFT_371747 [Aaosphaeria arxii CBS 175.79]